MIDGKLRAPLVDYSRRLHARGWVANHDGNLSVRQGDGRFLCTPTAFSKAEVTADSLVTVDGNGAVTTGRFRPAGETALHLAIYKDRPDVSAVIHAHPPHATALGAAGRSLDQPFLAEAVVSLGPQVPLVPLSAPGPAAVAALQPFIKPYDAVLIAGNGVFAWGSDLEQAYLRLELVEHLARIYLLALPAGGVKPLPAALLPSLLESRRKAGLGPEARGVATPGVSAPAPVPGAATHSDRLATLIREELAAALRR
jgi:L-fuculose-phosphate aldolase